MDLWSYTHVLLELEDSGIEKNRDVSQHLNTCLDVPPLPSLHFRDLSVGKAGELNSFGEYEY